MSEETISKTPPSSQAPGETARNPRYCISISKKALHRCLVSIIALIVLLIVFHAPILRGLTNLWIVESDVTEADYAVLLGGGWETRAPAVAELYNANQVDKIFMMREKQSETVELGLAESNVQKALEALQELGVPENAIELSANVVHSTYEEGMALKTRAETMSEVAYLIPTDPFHTRRVNWVVKRALRDTTAQFHIASIPPVNYDLDTWWKDEHGIVFLCQELAKYVFYRVRYA